MKSVLVFLLSLLLVPAAGYGKEVRIHITNEMIYQKLVEMEKRQVVLETELQGLTELMDRRFENVDRRFEDVNKRFEDINKRFEDINKRFEDINKRFDQMINFLWMLTGIFTTLTLGVIGFAYWDRRTIIAKAKEETILEIEKEGKLKDLIMALRELAKEDVKVARVLRDFGLL